MANNVIPTPFFENKYKRLSKKFPSLDNELAQLEQKLLSDPRIGTSLGANIFKVRLATKDKGKSGGLRIITYLIDENKESTDI
jgi:hypothetical protein